MALTRNRCVPARTLPNRKKQTSIVELSPCAIDFDATVRLGRVSDDGDTAKRIAKDGGENDDGPRR